jgi:hypothetical protein
MMQISTLARLLLLLPSLQRNKPQRMHSLHRHRCVYVRESAERKIEKIGGRGETGGREKREKMKGKREAKLDISTPGRNRHSKKREKERERSACNRCL